MEICCMAQGTQTEALPQRGRMGWELGGRVKGKGHMYTCGESMWVHCFQFFGVYTQKLNFWIIW